jgi:hypothetical protein
MILLRPLLFLFAGLILILAVPSWSAAQSPADSSISTYTRPERTSRMRSRSAYSQWKAQHIPHYSERRTDLGFWVRKAVGLVDTLCLISVAILIASALEVSGFVRAFGILLRPMVRLGRLTDDSAPPFITALRRGSLANSMLITARDTGKMDNRQLHTSILVVSGLSGLGHLPTYLLAIGAVCGSEAMAVVTGVRVGAVFVQIVIVLTISAWMARTVTHDTEPSHIREVEASHHGMKPAISESSFMNRVWKHSVRTLRRIVLLFSATYLAVGLLEFLGVFSHLATSIPWLFSLPFIPPEASVIVPAQAVSIYSGTAAVAGLIESGGLSVKHAVTILLIGSIITAPIRTLKRVMVTYVGMLGARLGVVMAVATQALRMAFLGIATWIMWITW